MKTESCCRENPKFVRSRLLEQRAGKLVSREKKARNSQTAQSSRRTDATIGAFKRHDRVKIKGLKNSPTYNGKVGAILEVKDRKVEIKLDKQDGFPNGEQVRVDQKNLTREAARRASKAQPSQRSGAGSRARPAQPSGKKPLPSQQVRRGNSTSTTRKRKTRTSGATSSPTKDLANQFQVGVRKPTPKNDHDVAKPNPRAHPATASRKASKSPRSGSSSSPSRRDHEREKQRPESKNLATRSPDADSQKVIRLPAPAASTSETASLEKPAVSEAELAPPSQPAATAATPRADADDRSDPAAQPASAAAERDDTAGTSDAEHKSGTGEPEAEDADAEKAAAAEAPSQNSLTEDLEAASDGGSVHSDTPARLNLSRFRSSVEAAVNVSGVLLVSILRKAVAESRPMLASSKNRSSGSRVIPGMLSVVLPLLVRLAWGGGVSLQNLKKRNLSLRLRRQNTLATAQLLFQRL